MCDPVHWPDLARDCGRHRFVFGLYFLHLFSSFYSPLLLLPPLRLLLDWNLMELFEMRRLTTLRNFACLISLCFSVFRIICMSITRPFECKLQGVNPMRAVLDALQTGCASAEKQRNKQATPRLPLRMQYCNPTSTHYAMGVGCWSTRPVCVRIKSSPAECIVFFLMLFCVFIRISIKF